MYGKGISKVGEIIDLGSQADIIEKSGAWYAYNGEKIGQGRENSKRFLLENPAILDEIEAKIRANSSTVEEIMLDGDNLTPPKPEIAIEEPIEKNKKKEDD
jgi:recombination protein RecA